MKDVLYAAHPDDELLGASKLLLAKEVAVVALSTTLGGEADGGAYTRALESQRLAEHLGYTALLGVGVRDEALRVADRILVPAATDRHPEHQEARTRGLRAALRVERLDALWEYSIEKFDHYAAPLRADEVAAKRDLFRRFFPSQQDAVLDPKYLLFEGTAPLGAPRITVTAEAVGWHFWKDAPDEVAYLRHPHRHVFRARATLGPLGHHDRELEFHIVQREMTGYLHAMLDPTGATPVPLSCEAIALELGVRLRARHDVPARVEVWEDGENGAEVVV